MSEIWKDIPGYEGVYQASDLGRIRSLDRFVCRYNKPGQVLSPNDNGKGYLSVMLGANNRKYVHRLVALAFLCGTNSKFEINHKNLDKSDNSLKNLEIVTRQQNQRHMIRNGKHNKAKLTKEQVLIIKNNPNNLSREQLTTLFNVSKSTISNVINNKTWGWL